MVVIKSNKKRLSSSVSPAEESSGFKVSKAAVTGKIIRPILKKKVSKTSEEDAPEDSQGDQMEVDDSEKKEKKISFSLSEQFEETSAPASSTVSFATKSNKKRHAAADSEATESVKAPQATDSKKKSKASSKLNLYNSDSDSGDESLALKAVSLAKKGLKITQAKKEEEKKKKEQEEAAAAALAAAEAKKQKQEEEKKKKEEDGKDKKADWKDKKADWKDKKADWKDKKGDFKDKKGDFKDKKAAPVDSTSADSSAVADASQENTKKIDPKSEKLAPNSDSIYHLQPKDLSKDAEILPEAAADSASATSSQEKPLESMGDSIFTTHTFEDLKLTPRLISLLESPLDQGGFAFTTSTSIQSLTIPPALKRQDHILLKSQTGSGKTLSFVIPVIETLLRHVQNGDKINRSQGTRAVILLPTRELAQQIENITNKIVNKICVWAVTGSLTGGEKRKNEKKKLKKGSIILICTPGRLLDHLRYTESFNLMSLQYFIMDEVDRLLDMGFEQTVLEILSRIFGYKLPGLRSLPEGEVMVDADSGDETDEEDKNKVVTAKKTFKSNLEKKYKKYISKLSKKCHNLNELKFIFASATLTTGVRELAWPILGSSGGFIFIDGDAKTVFSVKSEADLVRLAQQSLENDERKKEIQARGVNLVGINPEADQFAFSKAFQSTEAGATSSLSLASQAQENQIVQNVPRISGVSDQAALPTRLSQFTMIINLKWRLACLVAFLFARKNQKLIVFFNTCDAVDYYALLLREMSWPKDLDNVPVPGKEDKSRPLKKFLNSLDTEIMTKLFGPGLPILRLHGKMTQQERKNSYQKFNFLKSGVLFCTDVAARGLDLPSVDWILQYDPPCDPADYIHRIGRTARKGEAGSSLIFLLPNEISYNNLLLEKGLVCRTVSSSAMLGTIVKEIPGIQKFKNSDELVAVALQRRAENIVGQSAPLGQAAVQAYRSHIRAYATHSGESKGIFKVQSLHLGHLAKSFGLRETPKEFSGSSKGNAGDILARISNGEFEENTKAKNSVFANPDNIILPSNIQEDKEAVLKRAREVAGGSLSDSEDEVDKKKTKPEPEDDKTLTEGSSKSGRAVAVPNVEFPAFKKREVTFGAEKGSKKVKTLTASGKFRKAGGGYFRKPIRPKDQKPGKKTSAARALSEFES